MKKIKKIAAILLILSLTSGIFAQEIKQPDAQRADKKSAVELREKLAFIFTLTGGLSALVGSTVISGCGASCGLFSQTTINVSKYLFWCGTAVMTIGLFLIPNEASAAELPKTAEYKMHTLYGNPFLLLDKKRFTDYDIKEIESKYPAELIKYMEKFQTFLEFSKKENKKNWDKINWIYIKNQTYLKAGKPRFMKDDGAEDDYDTEMSLQEIMSDEFFYSEFLSYGYWPQFLEVFGEVVSQQRESFEREQRQLAEIAKKKAEILKGFNIKNYCQNLQKLKEGFAGKDILKYSECK